VDSASVRQSPEVSAHADRVAERVRDRDRDRPWYRYAYQLLPKQEVGPWFDLGCGQGELLEHAGALGLDGFGLDFSGDNAKATLGSGRPALVADLNRPLPFASGSLAGGTLVEVIEHIIQAESLVAELHRVIRPGGWLILTTPNVVHWTYRFRALTGHPPKQEGYHYRFFTKSLLRKLLAEAGFAVREEASFGKNALLTRILKPIRGRGFKYRYRVPAATEGLLAQHFVWRLERVA
jgi:SAM-dependent methyltransferase